MERGEERERERDERESEREFRGGLILAGGGFERFKLRGGEREGG